MDSYREMAKVKIEQPSYKQGSPFVGSRFSEGDLYEIAARSEINPNAPGWWQGVDAETVRLYRNEAKARRGPPPLTPKQRAAQARAQERALKAEQKALDSDLTRHYAQLDDVKAEAEAAQRTTPQASEEQAPTTPRVRRGRPTRSPPSRSTTRTSPGRRRPSRSRASSNAPGEMTPEEMAALRRETPKKRPVQTAQATGAVPPPQSARSGPGGVPTGRGVRPQSEVPIRPNPGRPAPEPYAEAAGRDGPRDEEEASTATPPSSASWASTGRGPLQRRSLPRKRGRGGPWQQAGIQNRRPAHRPREPAPAGAASGGKSHPSGGAGWWPCPTGPGA